MNPRTRQITQKLVAITLFVLGLTLVVLAFRFSQIFICGLGLCPLPDWWLSIIDAYHSDFSWWPTVNGLLPETLYSARIYFTIAIGLTIFLPQVETTFVSLMRRRSPIGTPYVDRTHFTCPVCGTVNRPSVQFCVKCGSQISSGTRYWERLNASQSSVSLLKGLLGVGAFLAFFVGLFDLTIYSALTNALGTDPTVVLFGTMVSVIPSFAGYVALKEGPWRGYASLKQFDKLVFGNRVWFAFGLLFIILALASVLSGFSDLTAVFVVFLMQLALGVLMVTYPTLRRKMARLGTQTVQFDDSRVW